VISTARWLLSKAAEEASLRSSAALLVLACSLPARANLPLPGPPASCPSGIAPGNPNNPTMPSPHIVHRYYGQYWTQDPRGQHEAAVQSAKWQGIISNAAYFAPFAQYQVGQGVWATPAIANPEDSNIPTSTVLENSEMGRRLADDLAFDMANGLPEPVADNTIYVVYLGPGIVTENLVPPLTDENGFPIQNPATGDDTPDLTKPLGNGGGTLHWLTRWDDPYHPGSQRNYRWIPLPYFTASNTTLSALDFMAQGNSVAGQLAITPSNFKVDYIESHEIDEQATDVDHGYNGVDDKCEGPGSYFYGTTITRTWSNAACACVDRAPQPPAPQPPANCTLWVACGGVVGVYCDVQNVDHFMLQRHVRVTDPALPVATSSSMTSPETYVYDSSTTGLSWAYYHVCAVDVMGHQACTTTDLFASIDSAPVCAPSTGVGSGGTSGGPVIGGGHHGPNLQ
jgi:hypothetical protein